MGGRYSGERPWRRVRDVVTVPAPAAGADWSITVPSGQTWEVVAIHAELVSSGTVANRQPALAIDVEGSTVAEVSSAVGQAASATHHYSWVDVGAGYSLGVFDTMPFPRMVLEPGAVLSSVTTNLQAGDQWGAIALYIVRTMVRGGAVDLADLPAMLVEVVTGPAE